MVEDQTVLYLTKCGTKAPESSFFILKLYNSEKRRHTTYDLIT